MNHQSNNNDESNIRVFVPQSNDVIHERGGRGNNHEGNIWYRRLLASLKDHRRTLSPPQKAALSRKVVRKVRQRHPPGRFLKQDPRTKLWFDVGDQKAFEKTSQAFRDVPSSPRQAGSSISTTSTQPSSFFSSSMDAAEQKSDAMSSDELPSDPLLLERSDSQYAEWNWNCNRGLPGIEEPTTFAMSCRTAPSDALNLLRTADGPQEHRHSDLPSRNFGGRSKNKSNKVQLLRPVSFSNTRHRLLPTVDAIFPSPPHVGLSLQTPTTIAAEESESVSQAVKKFVPVDMVESDGDSSSLDDDMIGLEFDEDEFAADVLLLEIADSLYMEDDPVWDWNLNRGGLAGTIEDPMSCAMSSRVAPSVGVIDEAAAASAVTTKQEEEASAEDEKGARAVADELNLLSVSDDPRVGVTEDHPDWDWNCNRGLPDIEEPLFYAMSCEAAPTVGVTDAVPAAATTTTAGVKQQQVETTSADANTVDLAALLETPGSTKKANVSWGKRTRRSLDLSDDEDDDEGTARSPDRAALTRRMDQLRTHRSKTKANASWGKRTRRSLELSDDEGDDEGTTRRLGRATSTRRIDPLRTHRSKKKATAVMGKPTGRTSLMLSDDEDDDEETAHNVDVAMFTNFPATPGFIKAASVKRVSLDSADTGSTLPTGVNTPLDQVLLAPKPPPLPKTGAPVLKDVPTYPELFHPLECSSTAVFVPHSDSREFSARTSHVLRDRCNKNKAKQQQVEVPRIRDAGRSYQRIKPSSFGLAEQVDAAAHCSTDRSTGLKLPTQAAKVATGGDHVNVKTTNNNGETFIRGDETEVTRQCQHRRRQSSKGSTNGLWEDLLHDVVFDLDVDFAKVEAPITLLSHGQLRRESELPSLEDLNDKRHDGDVRPS